MFTGLLNNEAIFLAQTIRADSYGGQSVTLGTVSGPHSCLLRQLSAREREMLLRVGIDGSYRLYCDVVTVLNSYVVQVEDIQYDIVQIHNPNFMDRHLQIDLERKQIGKV